MSIRDFCRHTPRLGQRVYVAESADVIGQVVLEDDVSIWPQAVVRGDVNTIRIGAGTNVQDGSVLHVTHDSHYTPGGFALSIGRGVTVGHKVTLHACTVGDYVLVGIGAIVLDGAVIEDYVMLGAGALVPPGRHLEGGYLYLGAPVRQARALKEAERDWLDYSWRHYVALKNRYLGIDVTPPAS